MKNKIYQLQILLNTSEDTCQIKGTGDTWLDLAILMEALGMNLSTLIQEGRDKEKLYKYVLEYFEKVKDDYRAGEGKILEEFNF